MATTKPTLPDHQFDQMATRQENHDFGLLSGQPKVRILLPIIPGDKQNLPLEVFLNGVPYFIPRGVSVEVPEDIAAILCHAGMA